MNLIDTREVTYSEYTELMDLYRKQMTKTAELQEENTALHNVILELRETVDILRKKKSKSGKI